MSGEFSALEAQILSGKTVEIPAHLANWLEKPKRLFIGGKWTDAEDGKVFSTVNPATEKVLASIALATRGDVERAVTQARAAFEQGVWARLAVEERASVLRKLGALILEHRAPLAILETLDTGKPLRESFDGDIPRAAYNFQFFADFACQKDDLRYDNSSETHYAYREPLGVVALITPWNLPLYLETWKLAPALMMGNSIVLKPSELSPLTAMYLTELIERLGLPPGVFNLVQGLGEASTGEFLTSHPGVDAISFTGETSTGRAIMKSAACGPTRVSFELGGKGASLIFADAAIDNAVEESLRASFRNQGEICLCCPRIFVEKSRYEEFLDRFVSKARLIRVGDPLNYGTQMGALISQDHWKKVVNYVNGVRPPGRILTGGKPPAEGRRGFFLEPTVISELPLDHPISREEVFGPVVSVYPFDDEEEAVRAANATPYGLSATVWTSDLDRAERVSRRLRSGLVWINCWFIRDLRVPFGGQKRSGVGREGGRHSLDFFSEWKSVCVKTGGES